MSSVKVLLIEDELLWQEGIQALLASADEPYEVVGVADCYEEALELFNKVQPDIILLDWKIQGGKDGLAVGKTLLEKGFPAEKIILVTGSQPSVIPDNPFGYVPKQQISFKLLDTLHEVLLT